MPMTTKNFLFHVGLLLCPSRTMSWVIRQRAPSSFPSVCSIQRLCNSKSSFSSKQTTASSCTSLGMISNIMKKLGGGGGDNNSPISLPRDVKEAVRQCRESTQAALQNRCSRMDIEFPVGTKFGVEKAATGKQQKRSSSVAVGGDDTTAAAAALTQSDRELARLFVDMFQPVGGNNIAVAFTDVAQADAAKKQWKNDPTAICRILSMDRRRMSSVASKKKKEKVKAAKGFAAKLAAEINDDASSSSTDGQPAGPFQLPENTEVALFVAPGPKELVVIEKICNSVGMDTLVILLNARLGSISNFGTAAAAKLFGEQFETVFHLTAVAPQEAAPNCLLYRAYPGKEWALARKPAVGQPKVILTQPSRPSTEECRNALDQLELSDVERGVENVVENVASWFR